MVVVIIGGFFGSGLIGFFFGSGIIGILSFGIGILIGILVGGIGFFVIKFFGVFIILLIMSMLFG